MSRSDERCKTGDPLTPREWQVLTLAAQGMTAKDMARHLALSPRTIEIFRRHAVTKIGGRTMGHAIALAITNRVTSLDTEVKEEEFRPRRSGRPRSARASKEDAAAWLEGGAR